MTPQSNFTLSYQLLQQLYISKSNLYDKLYTSNCLTIWCVHNSIRQQLYLMKKLTYRWISPLRTSQTSCQGFDILKRGEVLIVKCYSMAWRISQSHSVIFSLSYKLRVLSCICFVLFLNNLATQMLYNQPISKNLDIFSNSVQSVKRKNINRLIIPEICKKIALGGRADVLFSKKLK